ncbi:MAG: lipid A deacylase LpxR family protein [Halioglobus sp.]|nr:lipid A deacylase LpxR family protein [Halioglobus sp.]
MNLKKHPAALLFMGLFTLSAAAQEQPWTLTAYFENDLFANTDQSYTNGVRLSWISPDVSSYERDKRLPGFIRSINDTLHFFHDINTRSCGDPDAKPRACLRRNLVISLGQIMFTPKDRLASEVIQDDRPYAGYLYATFGYHTRDETQLDTIEVSLGLVGPASLAQESQDFIHKLRGIPRFKGWDNQLRNEPVLQVLYEHKHKTELGLIAPGWQGPDWMQSRWLPRHDLITHFGTNLGNARVYANAGFEYRIGLGLPDDFGSAALRPGGDNSAPGRDDPRMAPDGTDPLGQGSLHLFTALDARWVLHDIFLDGNTFRDSHSVDKRPVVGDLSVGLGLLYERWKVSVAMVWRSKTFDKQDGVHKFGSISLSYTY